MMFEGRVVKGVTAELVAAARKKLRLVDGAASVEQLRQPPGNRLEKLHADRAGYWSIRVNDQWRVCFRWEDGHAYEVEVVDHH